MGLHRNSSDFPPSRVGRSGGTDGFYQQAEGTRTARRETVGWRQRMGGGAVDEWNRSQREWTELAQLPSSHTSAASLFTLTGG